MKFSSNLFSVLLTAALFIGCGDRELVIETEAAAPAIRIPLLARPTASDSVGIFVDALSGSDSGDGTMAAPLKTLQIAEDVALAAGKEVFVAGGAGQDYGSAWIKVNTWCGFNPSGWTYVGPSTASTINAHKWYGIAVGDGVSAVVDSCIINGGDSSNTYTAGVVARGGLTLTNSTISGGEGSSKTYGILAGSPSSCVVKLLGNDIFSGTPSAGNATGVVNRRCTMTITNNTITANGGTDHSIGFNSWGGAISTTLTNNVIDGGDSAAINWAVAVDSPSQINMYHNGLISSSVNPDTCLLNKSGAVFTYWDINKDINDCPTWSSHCATDSLNNICKPNVFMNRTTTNLLPPDLLVDTGMDAGADFPGWLGPVDSDGDTRGWGHGWDIGRDEYAGPRDDLGIFVTPTGDDLDPGTMALPMGSLREAIAAAQDNGLGVFAAGGTYNELPEISGGVNIISDFNPSTWVRDPAGNRTIITGGPGPYYRDMGLRVAAGSDAGLLGSDILVGGTGTDSVFGVDNAGRLFLQDTLIRPGDTTGFESVGIGNSGQLTGQGLDILSGSSGSYSDGIYNPGGDLNLFNSVLGGGDASNSDSLYGGGQINLVGDVLIGGGSASGNNSGLTIFEGSANIINTHIEGGLTGGPGLILAGYGSPIPGANVHNSNFFNCSPFVLDTGSNPITDLPTLNGCTWSGCNGASGNDSFTPGFVGGGDYHLDGASSLQDIGINPAPILDHPLGDFDLDMNDRPAGLGWDIGADEFIP